MLVGPRGTLGAPKQKWWGYSYIHIPLTCDQALFSKRKIEPNTILLRNVFFDWYWLTFNKIANQNFFCLHDPRYANFPSRQFAKSHANAGKIRKSSATIYLLDTSTHIYTIANLKVLVLYMVALSELTLNENSKHEEVVMYQNMLHAWILSHFRWYPEIFSSHLSPIFCVKKPWAIKRNTFSFIL